MARILVPGDKPKDSFTVERFIGEGAFSEVFRITHRFLGRQALKVFKAEYRSEDQVQGLLAEAALLSRVGHPNIIRVFDAGLLETRHGPRAFFTMEYVPGGNLASFWESYGDRLIPVEDSVEIAKQMCRGLDVAHSQDPPIVHRDIKPQNILVGYDASGMRIRVGDFGLAKSVDPVELLASARGTLPFKAPEALAFQGADSTASDVWSLGCVLYLLLTDRMPFDESVLGVFFGPDEPALSPPSKFNVYVDEALDEILAKMLAPKARDRYQTAGEALGALSRWQPVSLSSRISQQSLVPKAAPVSDYRDPDQMVKQALLLGRQPDGLMEAADLLEQAVNLKPSLRKQYESNLRLWRRGIFM